MLITYFKKHNRTKMGSKADKMKLHRNDRIFKKITRNSYTEYNKYNKKPIPVKINWV